jgi:RNA polymerase sigma-70 factor (ECF subfamily)
MAPGGEAARLDYADELELVAGVVAGNAEAAARFVRRVLPSVRRATRGIVRAWPGVDDAEQVSLMDLLASASNYAGRGPLEAWAQRIATRSTLRWAKQERRVAEKAQAQQAQSVPAETALQTEFVGSLPRPLDHYLDQLSEVQRTAVLLRFSIGHTIPEIAKITQVAIPTVKSRIQKGRDELRRLVRRDLGLGVRRGELLLAALRQRGKSAPGAPPGHIHLENSSTHAAWAPPHVQMSAPR